MNGWLLYKHDFLGFLHWGYNYWHRFKSREMIDPFHVSDPHGWKKGWIHGDPFIVYPGPDGPIDSVRGEAFAEGLQDYALLQTLKVDRNGRMLSVLKDMEHYPRSNVWLINTRRTLFQQGSKTSS